MVTPWTTLGFAVSFGSVFSGAFLVAFWPSVGPCSIGFANWTCFFADSAASGVAATTLPSLAFCFLVGFLDSPDLATTVVRQHSLFSRLGWASITFFFSSSLEPLLLRLGELLLGRLRVLLLLLLVVVLGRDLDDTGVLDIVKLVPGIGIAAQHVCKLVLVGREVVVFLVRVLVRVVDVFSRDNVIAGKEDVVATGGLEESLLVLADDNVQGLLANLYRTESMV